MNLRPWNYHQWSRETVVQFTLRIDGMHCGACIRRVSETLASIPGIAVDKVQIGAARLNANVEPATVDAAIAALAKAGYAAHLEA